MTIRTPANAFSAQSNLYEWVTGPQAIEARLAFFRAYRDDSDVEAWDRNDIMSRPVTQEEIDLLMRHMGQEAALMKGGIPVFVTADVMDLVDEAVEEMPSEVLLHDDLPFDEFVLWFERPLMYHPRVLSLDGTTYYDEHWDLSAVGVQYVPNGVVIFDRANEANIPGSANAYMQVDGKSMDTLHGAVLDADGHDLRDGVTMSCYVEYENIPKALSELSGEVVVSRRAFGPYGLIDFVGCGFDVDWSQRDIDSPARLLHKWLIALMRLMGEHIELRSTGVPRQLKRSAVRAGRKIPADGYLSVMHLRSIAYEDEGDPNETEAQRKLRWKHRVRGHWQKFYCASRKLPVGDPGAYRHRYVNAYVRGPGDRVVESQRVVVVDR